MKCICIDNSYYCSYPEEINNVDDFAEYLNNNYNSFIKLKFWKNNNCVAPYFIEEEYEYKYVNVNTIENFCEEDITVLSSEEYDTRLTKVVAEKCVHCTNYVYDSQGDNLKGHRDKLSLTGECWCYEKIDE